MTLELSRVTVQIEDMGRVLAERDQRLRRALPAARELLKTYAREQDLLCEVAESEAGKRLRCASPGDEPLDGSWAAPDLAATATLIAVDGSQIYPDRHGVALYYAINTGSVIFRHGSGEAPRVASEAQICYTEDKVYPGGSPISLDLVSAERNLAEMCKLADLALGEPAGGPPCLALVDGPLLIWLQRAQVPEAQQTQILESYLACLDRMRDGGAPGVLSVSGFVSRPRSAEVVALLYLASLEPERRDAVQSLSQTPFAGLADRALFGFLEPGCRSALFVRGTAANLAFRARGHAVYFFYLNTGTDLARVEIPQWVAHNPERLSLVHAGVYEQGRFNNGYPYVLTRADEQAVILGEEREALEAMIVRAMMRHGVQWPEASRKAQQKQRARWRRR
jgi:hypothetical protein